MADGSLTELQQAFVREYLKDLNATQAAKRAGYSENTARQTGSENLSKPDIQDAISQAMAERARRIQVDQDRVVQELAKIAFANMKDFADWTNRGVSWKPSTDLTREDSSCVAEVTEQLTDKSITLKLKLHDKVKALELLGRHLGLFDQDLSKDKQQRPPIELKYRLDDEKPGPEGGV
jgi:phage terminase small subunit